MPRSLHPGQRNAPTFFQLTRPAHYRLSETPADHKETRKDWALQILNRTTLGYTWFGPENTLFLNVQFRKKDQ